MSISKEISAHLPYLRRFARALVGTREGGDAFVMATLEVIVAEPQKLQANDDLRVALYKTFLSVWSTTAAGLDPAPGAVEDDDARRSLDAISLRPRIAFLLQALEGFDLEQIGDALGIPETAAADLIDVANAEIADQLATDVLIIEDEPLIAHDLRSIVEELGHSVVGMARTHREAVAMRSSARSPRR